MATDPAPNSDPLANVSLSRLEWTGAAQLPSHVSQALLGPGAPFELVTETIRGLEHQVFAHRARSLRAAFDATAARQPDADLLASGERSWSFTGALREIDAYGRVLVEIYGIKPGDRVGIVAANSVEYAFALWAVVSVGAVVASLNGWWTGSELAHGIELSAPSLILGDAPRLARLSKDSVPDGVPVVPLDDLAAEAAQLGSGGESWVVDVDEDDPVVILFTSGTTGKPKGATLSHRNVIHFGMANMLAGAIGMMTGGAPTGPQMRPASILASPMFHVSGLVAILQTGPMMGAKLVLPSPGRWDPTEFLQLTHDHAITVWSGVPTQFWRVLRHPDLANYDITSVRTAGGGGATFAPELIRTMNELIPNAGIGNGYGMSETMGMGTRIGGPMILEHPDSVGGANPTVLVEIRNDDGEVLPEGEVGEIFLRCAAVFIGYWNDDNATRESIDPNGWYRTGDFGRVSGGLLYLESRRRDLILRGGENIYPIEIENCLVAHPLIDDAAVIGVDHPDLGQEVKAFVVLSDPGAVPMSVADVQAWVGEHLARFKVPAYVEFRRELPYTETGKVQKVVLEAQERQTG